MRSHGWKKQKHQHDKAEYVMKATALKVERPAAYEAPAALETVAREAAANEAKTHGPRNIALGLAAPLIGLAFVLVAPIAGLAALAWVAAKALAKNYPGAVRVARNVALFVAAPFIGLAYAALFPFVGLGALVWVAVKRTA
jgi:hypothetical protein